MNRTILSILVPPLAVCRYGCAACCAAPIAVFWIAGIIGLIYGYFGGPLELASISWNTIGLGIGLWAIAALWSTVTIRSVDADQCERENNPLCSRIVPHTDESDPLEQVRKSR